ncbi:MAG: DUF5011 domain-containing protein [Parcubacteria group bacterium]|nr:DUF5011 domain-containing protein [Parcubacteria group bacterium]
MPEQPVTTDDLSFDGTADPILDSVKSDASVGPRPPLASGLSTPLDYTIQNLATNETIERIGAFSELFVASLKVGQLDVSDLKLAGFTQGSVIFARADGTLSQNNAGFFWDNTNARLGIGTASPSYGFSVLGSVTGTSANAIAAITNNSELDADTNVALRLNTGAVPSTTNARFAAFYAGVGLGDTGGVAVGSIKLNNNAVAYATAGSDYAEEMEISEDTEPGDIIAATSQGQVKAIAEQFLIGVVSDSAGFIGNSREIRDPAKKTAIVGLLGQIRTKVSTEQGAIRVGDPIAVSVTMPGVGVRSSEAGQVVGIALESFGDPAPVNTDDQQTSESISGFAVGEIMVFVNPHWIGGDLSVEEKDSQLVNLDPEQLRSALAGLGLAVDTEGTLTVKKIVAQNIEIGTSQNPSGLTLYDENGNPRCVKVLSSGQLTSFDGTCEAITLANMDSTTSSGAVTDTVSPTDTDITIISDGTTTPADTTTDTSISSDTTTTTASPVPEEPAVDSTPPVIALLGEATINLEVGATYIDAGATAADDVDGDITQSIVVLNPVDTATPGTYTVTYTVSDSAGNQAQTVTRTVNIIEPAPEPVSEPAPEPSPTE